VAVDQVPALVAGGGAVEQQVAVVALWVEVLDKDLDRRGGRELEVVVVVFIVGVGPIGLPRDQGAKGG
jgi:hypothetical protein